MRARECYLEPDYRRCEALVDGWLAQLETSNGRVDRRINSACGWAVVGVGQREGVALRSVAHVSRCEPRFATRVGVSMLGRGVRVPVSIGSDTGYAAEVGVSPGSLCMGRVGPVGWQGATSGARV